VVDSSLRATTFSAPGQKLGEQDMAYWLVKSEPHKYSWDMMVKDGRTHWDGVRNHQAAIRMVTMQGGVFGAIGQSSQVLAAIAG
jgi:predicted RNA-binding protein with PUA-like domain